VWNAEGEVVAIHARGNETSSFELPIDYVVDALAKIQSGEPIKRGEIGVDRFRWPEND
jgi:S1-C subfamily serine protease